MTDFLDKDEALVLLPLDPLNNKPPYNIHKGSAIVARPFQQGKESEKTTRSYIVDYEGNIYGATNLKSFGAKLQIALSRQLQAYPTSARVWIEEADLNREFRTIGIAKLSSLNQEIERCRFEGITNHDASRLVLTLSEEDESNLKKWTDQETI